MNFCLSGSGPQGRRKGAEKQGGWFGLSGYGYLIRKIESGRWQPRTLGGCAEAELQIILRASRVSVAV